MNVVCVSRIVVVCLRVTTLRSTSQANTPEVRDHTAMKAATATPHKVRHIGWMTTPQKTGWNLYWFNAEWTGWLIVDWSAVWLVRSLTD